MKEFEQYIRGKQNFSLYDLREVGAGFLKSKGLKTMAQRDAEILLRKAFAMTKASFFARQRDPVEVDSAKLEAYQSFLRRRGEFEPLQYILEEQEFYGITFKVKPGVLIPRPETELLIDLANEVLGEFPQKDRSRIGIAELGVGSGAVILTLAKLWPNLSLHGCDLYPEPLALTYENACLLEVDKQIALFQGDLFSSLPLAPYHIVLSNPPYIPRDEITRLEPDVQKEPLSALDGGLDGLDFYRRIFKDGFNRVVSGGYLILELGDEQNSAVQTLGQAQNWILCKTLKDYQGKSRAQLWQKP